MRCRNDQQIVFHAELHIFHADAGHLRNDQYVVVFLEDVHYRLTNLLHNGAPGLPVLADVPEWLDARTVIPQPHLHGEPIDAFDLFARTVDLAVTRKLFPGFGELSQFLDQIPEALEYPAQPQIEAAFAFFLIVFLNHLHVPLQFEFRTPSPWCEGFCSPPGEGARPWPCSPLFCEGVDDSSPLNMDRTATDNLPQYGPC